MSEDDEFGLSSSDEAEMLSLLPSNGTVLKRKNEDDGVRASKKLRTEEWSAVKSVAISVLRERFGFHAFQLKQEAAITRLLDGDSAVVVFPTGES